MGGIDYLLTLRTLIDEIENDWPSVLARLETVRHSLLNRNALICNVTVDSENWQNLQPELDAFLAQLPSADVAVHTWLSPANGNNEGITLPAQVNYVGKAANLYELGYNLHGSIGVITNYLRTSFLWDKVRAQGGAYGAMVRFGRQSGVLTFLSYRDPNLLNTLTAYDQTAEFLRAGELTEDELAKNIIGAIGSLDAYQLPDAKGFTSLVRTLLGETDERRQQYRNEILGTTLADVKAFADVLDDVAGAGRVAVLGAEDAIESAADSVPLQNVWRIL
jgi:Zn-dependent M16 (insulinase) family peptidase